MSDNNKKEVSTNKEETINQEGKDIGDLDSKNKTHDDKEEETIEQKLKNTEDKLPFTSRIRKSKKKI